MKLLPTHTLAAALFFAGVAAGFDTTGLLVSENGGPSTSSLPVAPSSI